MATYKVEPYVIAADVYALAPHTGRGGWTWYTGSAGWMYRLIVESLLGVTLESDRLRFAPCLPADWTAFTMRYRYRETTYDIVVRQTPAGAGEAVAAIAVDRGRRRRRPTASVHLVDDRAAPPGGGRRRRCRSGRRRPRLTQRRRTAHRLRYVRQRTDAVASRPNLCSAAAIRARLRNNERASPQ